MDATPAAAGGQADTGTIHTVTVIAHISDPHVCARGELLAGTLDTAPGLRRAILHINTQARRPDAVIITGDLTNDGRPDQYDHLAELLDTIDVPTWVILGNHDNAEAAAARITAWLPAGGPRTGSGTITVGDVTIAAATSARSGRHDGELDNADIAHIATAVAAADGTALVALHHPPQRVGLAAMDTMGLDSNSVAALAAVCVNTAPAAVLCGHLHRNTITAWANTLVISAASTAYGVALDLRDNAPLAVSDEASTLLVHHIEGGYLTTHVADTGQHCVTAIAAP